MLRLAVLLLFAPAAAWLSARAPRATVSMRATASRRQALVFPVALLIASSVSAEDVAIDAAAPAPAPAGDAPPPSLPTPPPSLPTPPPRPSAVAAVQAEAKPFDPSRRGASRVATTSDLAVEIAASLASRLHRPLRRASCD